MFRQVKSAILAIPFTCFEKAVKLPKMNFLSGFLNLLRILVFFALFFGCLFASQSPPLSSESVVGYTYKVSKFCFRLRRVAMIIIFHFYFLLNLIFERKKIADKNTTDLKGQKIRTNQNTLKTFLLRTD